MPVGLGITEMETLEYIDCDLIRCFTFTLGLLIISKYLFIFFQVCKNKALSS